jgi:hypothetical protein
MDLDRPNSRCDLAMRNSRYHLLISPYFVHHAHRPALKRRRWSHLVVIMDCGSDDGEMHVLR